MKDITPFLSLSHSVIFDDSLRLSYMQRLVKARRLVFHYRFLSTRFLYFFSFFGGGASRFLLILRSWRTNYLRWVVRIRIRSRPRWRHWCQLSWVVAQVGITPDLRKEKRMLKRHSYNPLKTAIIPTIVIVISILKMQTLFYSCTSNKYVKIFRAILNHVRGKIFDILEIIERF